MIRSEYIKRLIRNHHRRLQKLKEKEALHGLDVAPRTLIEIEDVEEKIALLEQELEDIRQSTEAAGLTSAPPQSQQESPPLASTSPSTSRRVTTPRRHPALRQLRRWLLQK